MTGTTDMPGDLQGESSGCNSNHHLHGAGAYCGGRTTGRTACVEMRPWCCSVVFPRAVCDRARYLCRQRLRSAETGRVQLRKVQSSVGQRSFAFHGLEQSVICHARQWLVTGRVSDTIRTMNWHRPVPPGVCA